jgi:hypothetical protein
MSMSPALASTGREISVSLEFCSTTMSPALASAGREMLVSLKLCLMTSLPTLASTGRERVFSSRPLVAIFMGTATVRTPVKIHTSANCSTSSEFSIVKSPLMMV